MRKFKKEMNKKAITGVMLVLIISGIAVAMLFLGIFLSYKSFAEDLGVNFTVSSLIGKPHYSTPGKIIILDVTQETINQSSCKEKCEEIHSCDAHPKNENCDYCSADIQSNCESCKQSCESEYMEDLNYSKWIVDFRYEGNVPSQILLYMTEKRERDGVIFESIIVQNTTDYMFSYGNTGRFIITKPQQTPCHGEIEINLTADKDPNSKTYFKGEDKPSSFKESYDFCVSPPEKEVNISILSVDFDGSIPLTTTTVSITGDDVLELCPTATVSLSMTNKEGREVMMKDSGGDDCLFTIESDRSKQPSGWYSEEWKYRVTIELENDVGTDITSETALVELNLSDDYLGYDVNITDCEKEIVITTSDNIPLERNVLSYETDEDGYCTYAVVEFVVDSLSDGAKVEYYAYFGNPDANIENDDTVQYYPTYVVTDFTSGSSTNLTTDRIPPYLTLEETICQG